MGIMLYVFIKNDATWTSASHNGYYVVRIAEQAYLVTLFVREIITQFVLKCKRFQAKNEIYIKMTEFGRDE